MKNLLLLFFVSLFISGVASASHQRFTQLDANGEFVEVSHSGVTYNATVTINAGQAVYIDSSGGISPGKADALATSKIIGFAESAANPNQSVTVIKSGETISSVLTSATPGETVYLSPTSNGTVVTSFPAAGSGHVLLPVGYAKSATDLEIQIGKRIRRES